MIGIRAVADDGRAAEKFLALMVEDFKASFDKLFMEYCSLHGGLQFLSVSPHKQLTPAAL